MRTLTAAALAALLLLTGCGDGGSSGSSYDTPEALAEAIGGTCESTFEPYDQDEGALEIPGGPTAKRQGTCEIAGDDKTLVVLEDNDELEDVEALGKSLACGMGEALRVDGYHYVRGENWYVESDTRALAESFADSFEGEVVGVDCPGSGEDDDDDSDATDAPTTTTPPSELKPADEALAESGRDADGNPLNIGESAVRLSRSARCSSRSSL